jgi:hypothetical protein
MNNRKPAFRRGGVLGVLRLHSRMHARTLWNALLLHNAGPLVGEI